MSTEPHRPPHDSLAAAETAALLEVAQTLIRADAVDLDQAFEAAVQTLGRHATADSCRFYEFDGEQALLSKRYEWRSDTVTPTLQAFSGFTPASLPLLFQQFVNGDEVRINNTADLGPDAQPERRLFSSLSITALLGVPIQADGKTVGLLALDQSDSARVWTDTEAALLRRSARLFARALERRQTRGRLGFHVSNAPLGVVEWDADLCITRWSPKAEMIFGWTAAEVIGRHWSDWRMVHEDDVEAVADITDRLVAGDDLPNVLTNRNYTKSGDVITCEWFNSVLRDRAGRVISILSFVQDVTQNQRYQESLTSSRGELEQRNAHLEERVEQRTAELEAAAEGSDEQARTLQAMLDAGADHVLLLDAEDRCLYASHAVLADLGRPAHAVTGRTATEAGFPPALADLINRTADQARRQRHSIRPDTFDLDTDRGTLTFEYTVTPVLDARGVPHRVLCIGRDITQRLDTAQRLRLIQSAVDQIDESVTITDNQIEKPGPHIVYVNPAFTAMTGYSFEEALGQTPRILQGPRTDRLVIARLRRCLVRGERFFGEAINYRKDGSEYALEWHVNPVRDGRGNITHWVAIQRDVTQRKLAADLARVHREELAHVTRLSAMGEMASGIAHEINQPLAAIQNYASGALRRVAQGQAAIDDLAEAMRQVADQSDRAGQIIRRLRAFVTKRGTRRAPHHINDLVHETFALLEPDILKHQARVELDLAPDDRLPTIHVDGIQIEQVLVNLVRNGLEAMDVNPPEQRALKLTTRLIEDDHVLVTVDDRGPGLSASQRDYLFDPFFTTKNDGMGMGLTISQSIVQDHNGRLRATPNPDGPGTSFHLTLPSAND